MRNSDWFSSIHDYFTKRWFIAAILFTIPAFGFTFVELFGRNLGWIGEDGKLVSFPKVILIVLFVLSFLFSLLKSYADSDSDNARRNGQFVLDKMLQGVNTIKYKKFQRFVEYIDSHNDSTNASPFFEITQPKKQIEAIFDVIQEMLSEIFGISRNNVGISIVYKTDKGRKWDWLNTLNIENDLPLKDLLENPNSTIKKIIDGDRNLIFYPDKRRGIEKQEYISGRADDTNNNIGSIICKDISIATDHRYIHAILSVSTYGNQLCGEKDFDAIGKIERIILPAIERRLQLELALLYIREVVASPHGSNKGKK